MFDLDHDDVPGRYWPALKAFMTAFSYGEPMSKFPRVGPKSVQWLLDEGLLEVVENPRYGEAHGKCYRLTTLGQRVFARGQYRKRNALPPGTWY